MGNQSYKYRIINKLYGKKEYRLLILGIILTIAVLVYLHKSCIDYTLHPIGLDAAGKTTVLYRLKLGEVVTTIPTIGR